MVFTRRRVLLGLLLVVVLAGLAARVVYVLVSTTEDLEAVDQLVDEAAAALVEGRIADARTTLGEAQDLILSANETLRGSVDLELVGLLPVARQNLAALQDAVSLAATLVHGGGRVLGAAGPLESDAGDLEVSLSDGSIPLEAVRAARGEIELLRSQLVPAINERPPPFLAEPIRDARAELLTEARSRTHQLEVLERGLALLEELAGGNGPRRYLLAVANTAEMRGSGGMILNYGLLEGRDGTIDLAEFGRIDEIPLDAAVDEGLAPADYAARWSGFEPFRRFRQANLAGDYTVVAPVLEAMYQQATGVSVHGVIQIDPSGLAAVLEGVGPVAVPELGVVTADNVVDLVLNEAYIRFPDVEQRSDVLGDVAEAVFRRLVDGEFESVRVLAEAVSEAVEGRHILMHATATRVQRNLAAFGADGAYPDLEQGDAFALTVQNLAGNKLDYYLDTSLALTGGRPEGRAGAVEARVELTNTAPAGVVSPRYIFGPGPGPTAVPVGVLRTLVTVYLPLGASVEAVSGDPTVEPVSSGTEAGRPYAAFIIDVPASEARTVSIELRTAPRPPGGYSVTFVPAPRVRPTTVTVDLATGATPVRGTVVLDRTRRFSTAGPPVPVPSPVKRLSQRVGG